MQNLQWKVDFPKILEEISISIKGGNEIKIAPNILQSILVELTKRAIELNDVELNKIMIRLALYEGSHTKEMQNYLNNTP